MILYAAILFLTAIVFTVVAVQIYKGKIELIHDYHRTTVTDKVAYGKAFGKAMGIIAVAMALSAAVSLLGETVMWAATGVLVTGLVVGIVAIFRVQKKYNGGLF